MDEHRIPCSTAFPVKFLSILLAGGMTLGCGSGQDGPQRVGIRGIVTYQQQPVTRGVINLQPHQGTVGPATGTIVNNGSYEIRPDRGPAPGNYLAVLKIMTADLETTPHPDRVETKSAVPFQTYSIPIEVKGENGVIDFELPPDATSPE